MSLIVLCIIAVNYIDMPLWVKAILVFALGVDVMLSIRKK